MIMGSAGIWYSVRLTTGMAVALLLSSCGVFTPSEASGPGGRPAATQPVAVETALAQSGALIAALEYTGTTRPQQQIALRAQTAGEVTTLTVDVGDLVSPGEVLAQIDSGLLVARVNEAQAELSVRRSEVAEDQVSISDARAAAAQAQATRDQAKIDAERLRQLANQGAISQQTAEAAELELVNAEAAVTSAQAQIKARQQAIAAATSRVDVQTAVVAETQEQMSLAELRSQLPATVLTRLVDPGDYVQPGATLLELGDLSSLKVIVQVSELDLGRLSVGQTTQIRLDAFPDMAPISGRISRISPVADAATRLVPVEVTMANPDSRIGSGLLARVTLGTSDRDRIIVPASALETGTAADTIFVIDQTSEQPKVVARSVSVGQQRQGNVEILSGLDANETIVIASDQPLQSDQPVRLSILSETSQP